MTTNAAALCERRIYSLRPCSHVHAYAQLLLPITGSLTVNINSHLVAADETTILFIPPHYEHSFFANSQNEFFVFDIPQYFLQPYFPQTTPAEINSALDQRWQAIRTLLACEVRENPVDSQPIQHLLRYAMLLLTRDAGPASIRYIHENYHNRLTVAQLAALEHYHPSHYHQWFQKTTGTTPRLYIQRLRVNKAKELLIATGYSLHYIACQVGYGHQSTLTKAFVELEGVTPLHFRTGSRK
ncbi:AraC family transcriptional regulator|uniref:Transcriptional regulator, AraC family n=1 Tax=Dendrosporobacter quercicolus TaxID=146817 RepID=A0A1G9U8Q7_9FIRM|nr:AraC family transcriptional regulator [Dendrosporobacter quercicolus]NSL49953.1 AraC family transcriptional regulator [Dendrosporobacter quercicolus DSM 1736]SDM56377.1 transcriptional regulator, AraC family [Dendrosporobacter quercicolus]